MPDLSGLPYEDEILFGQYWSGFGDITLKCTDIETIIYEDKSTANPEGGIGHNPKIRYANTTVIDVFVRDNTGSYPNSLIQISNFIQKAIAEQKTLPQEDIEEMYISKIKEINDPLDESFEDNSIFHLRIEVEVKYWR